MTRATSTRAGGVTIPSTRRSLRVFLAAATRAFPRATTSDESASTRLLSSLNIKCNFEKKK